MAWTVVYMPGRCCIQRTHEIPQQRFPRTGQAAATHRLPSSGAQLHDQARKSQWREVVDAAGRISAADDRQALKFVVGEFG